MDIPLRIRIPRVPVAIQFTREGLIFVLLSLAIGAAAVNTGNNILYLIFSVMLGLIVVSGVLSRRMLSGLRAKLDFPSNLFAGVRNVCYVSLSNHKRMPSLGVRFFCGDREFPPVSRYFFYIPASTTVHGFAPVVFPRRGMYILHELEVQTRFPFSFFVKIRRFFVEQKLRVYPQIYHLPDEWLTRFSEGFLLESPYRGESHQLLHLREYGPNDSSKKIHWKASARAERFLVKEFQKEQGRDVYIYFDCYPAGKQDSALLDRAASLAASLAFLIRRKGLEATFVFADRRFRIGGHYAQLQSLLDHLAEMDTGVPGVSTGAIQPAHDAVVIAIRSSYVPSVLPDVPKAVMVTIEDGLPQMGQMETPVLEPKA